MLTARRAVLLLWGAVLALPVLAAACLAPDMRLGGCSADDRRLQEPLAAEARALGAADGARADGDAYGGCDEDDRFAYAGQGYAEPGGRAQVVAHYRAAADRNGWQPAPPDADEPAWRRDPSGERIGLCFTKALHGTTARLALRWDTGEGGGYTVEARASRTGGAWC
ncbi:hypothetical protein [Kitasatospora sp. NPDC059571]|uniref:hypothetical protein n=1 Tax=Kitasatospora sp. NPDC059571 TaxID=3346871 RepID=UPI0036A0DAE3